MQQLTTTRPERRQAQRTAQEIEELEQLLSTLTKANAPGGSKPVSLAVGQLLNHYPQKRLSPEAITQLIEDWIQDLGSYPTDVIFAVCQSWRRSSKTIAPTPGQLIALTEPIMAARNFHIRVLHSVLDAQVTSKAST
ncbi:hypothetical protein [Pseudovibrio sp. WM33]|uniref:hypothetical protein n=1 Tax=Pseudovibrio sp. WM33 TaxID=1735585 RepID=UPI00187D3E3D|nr:hypothetical protein [Pseudovibrio sp. WM33]